MSSSVAGLTLAAAVRRLVYDLKEVQEHPIPNVSALPLDDDLFVWHGNVRSSPEGVLRGASIHFIMRFPPDYPQNHPEVRLLQPIPHPNVHRVGGVMVLNASSTAASSSVQANLATHKRRPFPREAAWKLAMWDCLPGKNSWSSAYSVLSVLLQLQVFLLDEDLTYDTRLITPAQAVTQAHNLTCPHCPHSGSTPSAAHPPFPTEQQLAEVSSLRSKLTVTRPFVPARSRATAEQLKRHQQAPPAATMATTAHSRSPSPCPSVGGGEGQAAVSSDTSCSSSSAAATPSSSRSASSAGIAAAGGNGDGWTTVQHKMHKAHDSSNSMMMLLTSSSSSSNRGGYGPRGRGGRGTYGGRGGSSSGGGGRGWSQQQSSPAAGYHGAAGGRGGYNAPPVSRGGSSSSSRGTGRGAGRGGSSGRGTAAAAAAGAAGAYHGSSAAYPVGSFGGRGRGSSSISRGGGRAGQVNSSTPIGHQVSLQQQQQQHHHQQQQQVVTGGSFAVLLSSPAAAAAPAAASSSPSAAQPQQQQQPTASAESAAAAAGPPLTKAAKKNAARKARRQQQQQEATPGTAATSGAAGSNHQQQQQQTHSPQQQQQQQQYTAAGGAGWVEVKARVKPAAQPKVSLSMLMITPLQQQLQQVMMQPMQQLVQAAKVGTALLTTPLPDADGTAAAAADVTTASSSRAAAADWSAAAACEAQKAAAAGVFGRLERDALLEVLLLLPTADVAALGQTCRWLHEAVEDGTTWQLMMGKAFPGHRLKPSNMNDWKAAYQLESCAILDELRCWLTRASMDEDVLGLPLTFTLNPKTGKVDYILAHPDVLSVTAFKMGVRVTPQGERFEALLPLYLTASHFNRALPHMAPLIKQLAPQEVGPGGRSPPPEAWLEVLATILNTQVVLLSDNGLSVSQRTLSIYCQVHRLLLAVCEHWSLWNAVSQRLDAFLHTPRLRSKTHTPNLGLLLPLLAVGSPSRHSWARMSDGLLREALSRKVLWICKKDPSLEKNFTRGAVAGSGAQGSSRADPDLVKGSWEGGGVSSRLITFHVAFLQLVACPRGATLEGVMDSADLMYGWPAAALGVRFQKVVKHIQEVSSWQQWFRLLGRQEPSDAQMTDLLRAAWKDGAAKGYHKLGMDYSRIQARGVSRILLKGQSYGLPPAAKRVELHVHYKWRPEVLVYYLDGAILLMGPGRELLEAVAWNHTNSLRTQQQGAVWHSGDIMEFDNQKGYNWARINLKQLGEQVTEMYVTLSGWAGAQLSDIMQPYVQLFDADTGVELCQVHLDTMAADVKAAHKCIIMARFYKGADGKWTMAAVGSLCQGNTGDYAPMVEGCRAV